MKFSAIVLLAAILSCSAAEGYTQSVTLRERGISIEQALKMIQKQTGYGLFYDASLFDKSSKLNINVKMYRYRKRCRPVSATNALLILLSTALSL
ncbi:hypothetical protein [Niabella hibiscisoli]|uniref:hypothetical protein n=1 Tax=Niabella hibiscisoli TaxID=1825928 RepID=UPI001F0EA9BF|nr:hypothetical protein [Niabella hibiscisoli]MCH5717411.1 hypothetical protein [Niabella hibiscisoli]